jgi:hypothetical protein
MIFPILFHRTCFLIDYWLFICEREREREKHKSTQIKVERYSHFISFKTELVIQSPIFLLIFLQVILQNNVIQNTAHFWRMMVPGIWEIWFFVLIVLHQTAGNRTRKLLTVFTCWRLVVNAWGTCQYCETNGFGALTKFSVVGVFWSVVNISHQRKKYRSVSKFNWST